MCTDLTTKPWVQEAGVEVLNQPFYATGNIATAGGCFASQYLAAWVIARIEGKEAAENALHYVAPVAEKEDYVSRAMKNIAIRRITLTLMRPIRCFDNWPNNNGQADAPPVSGFES